MTKNRIALLGSAMMALVCAAGLAKAQDYDRSYDYEYDARPAPTTETVIVRPYYDRVERRQVIGRVNGEVNPTEFSISRPVNFSDLDLTRDDDYMELRERVRETARDLCYELDARVPGLRGDSSADRECIRTATRNAMRDVMDHTG